MAYVISMQNTFIRVSVPEEADGIKVRRTRSLPRTWKFDALGDCKEPQGSQSDDASTDDASTNGEPEQACSWATMSDDCTGEGSSDDFTGLAPWQLRPMPTPETTRTRLSVSSRVFEPRAGEIPSGVGNIVHALKLALCSRSQVTRVRVENGSNGFATLIYVTLQNLLFQACEMLGVAQGALLDATANSQNVYVLGYASQPFVMLHDHGFKAVLCGMPASVQHSSCWDSYQYGGCPRPSTCRWSHPAQMDMTDIHVILEQAEF